MMYTTPTPHLHHTYTTPGPTSRADISTVEIVVSVPKRSALKTSRPAHSEDESFGIGTLFGCRAIELEKPPQEGVIDTAGCIRVMMQSKGSRQCNGIPSYNIRTPAT